MSKFIQKTINTSEHKNYKVNIEYYDSAMEVAKDCDTRPITNSSFDDKRQKHFSDWDGVESYEQALDFLKNGHQETVESMRNQFKANISGQRKRFSFQNAPQGFSPIVPLALKGVPNCMIDMQMTQIKAKVLDIYYDMTCSYSTDSNDIIKAGQKILGTIMELEAQGYRFNLYAVQSYSGSRDADVLIVKIKSSTQPIDLKRISFPLCHTAFFRVIGFDWYSKTPHGKFRSAYGHATGYEFKHELKEFAEQTFGKNATYFTATKIIAEDKEYIKGVLTNDKNNK